MNKDILEENVFKNNSVVILTATILPMEQVEVLEKGLNFAPNTDFDQFHTIMDVNKFARLLMVKRHFYAQDIESVPDTQSEQISIQENREENEFENLLEQMSLMILKELQDITPEIQYANPQYYPKKSKVTALDLFQMGVEKDLVALHGKRTRNDGSF